MHIVTLIHVGTLETNFKMRLIESNKLCIYEHAYRHTNTCWDNFISYRIKPYMNMHIVTPIHVGTIL